MPKKFATENTKAVAARSRKAASKDELQARQQKEADDVYWQDDDKRAAKKQEKKDGQEIKRQEQLRKKAESKDLLEKEVSSLASSSVKKAVAPISKVTRAQIEKAKDKTTLPTDTQTSGDTKGCIVVVADDAPLEENLNRVSIDGTEARTIGEAIALLQDTAETDDSHPERRMKAAYNAYLERRLAELRLEYPTLRLSQLKQMIFKEWQRAPENPMNA